MKRKLTTIFCADVHGYSTMMSHDELETLDQLKRYRALMDALFSEHGGRKVNTWGDAVIAEFASVVEAVRCAVQIQDAINSENSILSEHERMQFRIGINLGDVMDDQGDLYGDGVNLAARLEALAEPGGIMVSESVYNLTRKQLAIGYDFAGRKSVKEAEEPIECYRITMPGSNHGPKLDEAQSHQSTGDARFEHPDQEGKVEAAVKSVSNAANNGTDQFLRWFPRQPKSVQTATVMIGFFLLINLLFSGITTPWFIFPSLPFLLLILLRKK